MTDFPIVLDNLIDENYQNKIEKSLLDCAWRIQVDNCGRGNINAKNEKLLSNKKNINISPIVSTNIMTENELFYSLFPLIEKSCTSINFKLTKIMRCISGIHILTDQKNKIDKVHIDRKTPHIVMLYYVTDSDGETILYNKTTNDLKNDVYDLDEIEDLKITHKIKPQKGRVVFFDGNTYHSSSTPSNGFRIIINLDLCGKFEDKNYEDVEKKCNKVDVFNYFKYS